MNRLAYAIPRGIHKREDCHFYHTMELPGFGVIHVKKHVAGLSSAIAGKSRVGVNLSRGFPVSPAAEPSPT
jgi:hypothetical protein